MMVPMHHPFLACYYALDNMSRTISTMLGLVFLVTFLALFGLTGCEKIVEVKVIETDTLRYPVTRKGPGFVRFVSMLPGPTDVTIALRKSSDKNSPFFTIAEDRSSSQYFPLPDSTATQIFAHFRVAGQDQVDSFWVPWLNPGELITCALFQVNGEAPGRFRLKATFGNDSLRLRAPESGMAYLRLINGLSDYPSPQPMVNLTLKKFDGEPVFVSGGTEPSHVGFAEFHNYVQVPAGLTHVFVKAKEDPTPLYTPTAFDFREGGYYTARLVGTRASGSDRFMIDTEN
jgi:hypothetical protein